MNTALPQRGEFDILIGEMNVKLKFSYSSMARMEQRLGYSLTKMSTEVAQMNIKLNAIVAVIYEGAQAAKSLPGFTDEQIGDLIVEAGYTVVATKVMTCIMKMMSTGKEEVAAVSGKERAEKEVAPKA